MMFRLQKYSRIVTAFLLVIITCVLLPIRLNAEEVSGKTVRVGYYENEVFEEGASEDAVKTGYAYEYYQKMSEYTGWKYEYVYGGFSELYDMLLAGDIDLLAGLAKREDREGLVGYPSAPMGSEIYTLVKHEEESSITADPSTLTGKKIGVLKSAIADVLEAWLDDQNLSADVISFDDYESLFAAFDQKKVDVLAAEGDGAYGREHAEVICSFGSSDYYLCVNIQRNDLLQELNQAQSELAIEEPDYLSSLRSRYYSASVKSRTFSEAEKQWVNDHSELRVGYLENYLPYCGTDAKGQVTGMVKDLIPQYLHELEISGIDVTYRGYQSYDDMIHAVTSGEIDTAFPVGGGLYYAEESGIYQSVPVVSASTDLVYEGEYQDEDLKDFAVNENNHMQYYYIRTNFPDAEINLYPSIDDCLEAVLAGDAGATTLNGLRANDILKNSRYKGLYLKQLGKTDDRCFGVKIGNEGLLKLLNHGINIVGSEYVQDLSYQYAGELYSYSFSDMLRDYIWIFLTILLLVSVLIILLIVRELKHSKTANRLKSDFVSSMSHEIRTPITAILGMNELIQRESSDDRILQYSDNIEKAGESLLGIINNILDFSKIEAGRMEISNEPYSLPELLLEQEALTSHRTAEKDLTFTLEVDEALPVSPVGDRQKLRQILANLLSNAIKYTESGEVKLIVRLLSKEEDHFTMEISVEDTGIGIRESEKNKLFSAFDRLDLERTRNIEGSGLGLAITQRMLSFMGSEIELSSEYGKGSRFFFCLQQGISDGTPIGSFRDWEIAESSRQRKRRQATFTAPTARLMIVDDTPMNLQVICGLLKQNNMQIDTAESGDKCIELFGQRTYDLIFLDQRMPNMDGLETLQELSRRYPDALKRTPVISLTANVLSGAKEQMLKAGFTDYLTKPVNLTQLEELLLRTLPPEKIQKIEASEKDTETEMETFLPEAIQSLPQLDTEEGIDYCGDTEDYLEALKIWQASAEEKAKNLETLLQEDNLNEYTLLVHSMKSMLRSIGAKELSAHAAKLEAAAREEDTMLLRQDTYGFTAQIRELRKALTQALPDSDIA